MYTIEYILNAVYDSNNGQLTTEVGTGDPTIDTSTSQGKLNAVFNPTNNSLYVQSV